VGWLIGPLDAPKEVEKIYRVSYTVQTDISTRSLVPKLRLRVDPKAAGQGDYTVREPFLESRRKK
jgi:hypothetical protein